MKYFKKQKAFFIALFSIAWILVVILAYAVLHKPFTEALLLGIGKAAWRITIAGIVILLAGGIGNKIAQPDTESSLAKATIQLAIGIGVESVVFLSIGSVTLSLVVMFPLILSTIVIFHKSIIRWCSLWVEIKDLIPRKGISIKLLFWLTITILACNLLLALAPPLGFDALTYHLALPKFYILSHHITYTPDIIYWGMPQQTETLYTIGMAMAGTETGPIIGWMIGVVTIMGLMGFVAKRFSPSASWAVSACLLSGWSISDSLSRAYVEWPVMLCGVSFLVCMDAWFRNSSYKNLVLGMVSAGLGLATKYTAGILLVAGIIIILIHSARRGWSCLFRNLTVGSLIAICISVPWLTKNILATGNPFYPLFFPSGAMDQIRLDFYRSGTSWNTWLQMLVLPWQATIWGIETGKGYMASIGPLFLGLSVLGGLNWAEKTDAQKVSIKTAGIISLVCFFIWAIGSRFVPLLIQSRLYFAFFPAWALLCGAGWYSLCKYKLHIISVERLVTTLIIVALGFNAIQTIGTTEKKDPLNVILGNHSEMEYLSANVGWYSIATRAITDLPSQSRVLMLWETRAFYCLPKCDPDEIIDRWFQAIRLWKTPEKVLSQWKQLGYTHILFSKIGADFIKVDISEYRDQDWTDLDTLLGKLLLENNFGNAYYLYKIP
jgi:4-amino-4-deoxy-L-arabinose transferase-like glycosyltransferase